MRLLHQAYEVAEREHRGQQRTSEEPFITHPIAVAIILAELGMDTTTLVAALLHDAVEDTGYTLEQTRADFGDKIAHLVDGVTKLDKMEFGQAAEAETIRKMIVAMALDLQSADHQAGRPAPQHAALSYQRPHKQQRTARATLEVLAPLANRLGLQVLRRDLEDLAFATLHPAEYDEIVRVVDSRDPGRREHVAMLVRQVAADLRSAKTKATVSPHPATTTRSTRRCWSGAAARSTTRRILVVVAGGPSDCYIALGAVHGRWHPVPGRFKDFIAAPKLNGYQSLHTTVIGPGEEPVGPHPHRGHAPHRRVRGGGPGPRGGPSPPGQRPGGLRPCRRPGVAAPAAGQRRAVSDPGEFLSRSLGLPTARCWSSPPRATP